MKLLLDTHTFIWWDSAPEQLSDLALDLCRQEQNELILSTVSLWEIQIKSQLGKLDLARPLAELIEGQREQNALKILDVKLSHVLALDRLPAHHRDPFDRLLVAQALHEGLPLLSCDSQVARYPVETLW